MQQNKNNNNMFFLVTNYNKKRLFIIITEYNEKYKITLYIKNKIQQILQDNI